MNYFCSIILKMPLTFNFKKERRPPRQHHWDLGFMDPRHKRKKIIIGIPKMRHYTDKIWPLNDGPSPI